MTKDNVGKARASSYHKVHMRRTIVVYATVTLLVFDCMGVSWAAPPASSARLRPIPTKPSTPPTLGKKIVEPRYACKRQLIVKGKPLPCDSFTERDGERLRPFLLDVPEAAEHLDLYQRNRRRLGWLPYLGTSAILLAGTGFLIGRVKQGHEWATITRNVMAISGVIILGSAFTYGFITLTLNERNFDNAIKTHNEATPQSPIEVKVDTTLFF